MSQCPDCGATFRPGTYVCAECGVEIYEDADERQNEGEGSFISIAFAVPNTEEGRDIERKLTAYAKCLGLTASTDSFNPGGGLR